MFDFFFFLLPREVVGLVGVSKRKRSLSEMRRTNATTMNSDENRTDVNF